jgi:hypothetical protein
MLQARDTVFVFDLATSRGRVIDPMLAELDRQSGVNVPQQLVTISGRVKVPGNYPLEPGMTVSDLLRAGGGLDQAAFTGQAELTRHVTGGGSRRESQLRRSTSAGYSRAMRPQTCRCRRSTSSSSRRCRSGRSRK